MDLASQVTEKMKSIPSAPSIHPNRSNFAQKTLKSLQTQGSWLTDETADSNDTSLVQFQTNQIIKELIGMEQHYTEQIQMIIQVII